MATLAKSEDVARFDWIKGDRPRHVHRCLGDESHEPHNWQCNSPYCEVLDENCPHHGGPPPIQTGREPWR